MNLLTNLPTNTEHDERRHAMTTTAVAAPVQTDDAATHRQILKVMTGLLAALFTAMLSTTIVSTALPTIMSDLNGTQRQYTWVITASLLAMTISTPIWGKLSDLFDKKILVQLSIVLFVAGSVGAGLSQSVPPMMAFRALQGLAMGGLIALTQSIMGALIPPRQRGRYSGYMGAVMAVSTVSGPLLGGVISDNASWRWCFFVCVPLAVLALVALQVTLHTPKGRGHASIDYLGAALIAVVAALPMLWVTFAGSDYAWISWPSAAFLAGFLAAVALAVVTELRAPEPMVPIRLLGSRTTVLMIVASIAVGVAMFGSGTFLTQYFQLAGGFSATRAGLMTIPLIVAQMLVSTLGGQLVTRTGRWKPLMVVGAIALVVGLAALGTIDHTTPYWRVAVFMAVMGVGIGALIQNIVLAVQNTVDVRDIGSTSATITFFRSLGGAVGVAVLGAVLANHVAAQVTSGLRAAGLPTGGGGESLDIDALPAPVQAIVHAAYGDSFGLLFAIAAATSVVTLVAVLLVREVPLRTTVGLAPAPSSEVAPAVVSAAPQPGVTTETAHEVAHDEKVSASVSTFDSAALDDPAQRLSVAALDVLTAAQDQARQHVTVTAGAQAEVVAVLDSVGQQLDALLAEAHSRLDAIKDRVQAADSGASLSADGDGGDSLRSYEYGLLLNSQRTADTVTRLARLEAERILTEPTRSSRSGSSGWRCWRPPRPSSPSAWGRSSCRAEPSTDPDEMRRAAPPLRGGRSSVVRRVRCRWSGRLCRRSRVRRLRGQDGGQQPVQVGRGLVGGQLGDQGHRLGDGDRVGDVAEVDLEHRDPGGGAVHPRHPVDRPAARHAGRDPTVDLAPVPDDTPHEVRRVVAHRRLRPLGAHGQRLERVVPPQLGLEQDVQGALAGLAARRVAAGPGVGFRHGPSGRLRRPGRGSHPCGCRP